MVFTMLFLLWSIGSALASLALGQNCTKPVAGPNMSLKDTQILESSFPDGSRATFQCNFGYTSTAGSRFVTCTAGTWSEVTLECERMYCGTAGELKNGDIVYAGMQFGDKATAHCNEGYLLFGRKELTCTNGAWYPQLPQCEAVVCEPPAAIDKGSYEPVKELYSYRQSVRYSCQKDYHLTGDETSVCTADKTFKPAPPVCTLVSCPELDVPHGWLSGSRPPHRYRASLTLSCNEGFQPVGAPNLICEINSEWSPGIPSCKRQTPVTTTVPPPRDGTTPRTTAAPDGTSSNVPRAIGIAFAVLTVIGVVSVCGCYYGGVPAIIQRRKNTGSLKTNSDREAGKEEETALSVRVPDSS